MSIRTARVASLLKEEIGAILSREYADPEFGFITVTDVSLTADLKIARVFFSVLGSLEDQARAMKMLDQERPHIRSIVASHLRLKYVPALQFHLDDTLNQVDRINQILKKIHGDDDNTANQGHS
jgi:ribosome-binding factor A